MSKVGGQTTGQARALEAEGDRLLHEYSLLVQTPTVDSTLSEQIQANIDERAAVVDGLFQAAYVPGAATTALQQAQRAAEVLDDHRATLRRLTSEISQERSRQLLLSNVRSDIQAHRASTVAASSAVTGDEGAYYGRERSRISDSHNLADSLMERVYETRAELVRQQASLRDVQRRILRVVGQVPGLNSLISKINVRQKRNSLILVAVVVFCVLFLLFVR